MDLQTEESSRKVVTTLRAAFTNPAEEYEAICQLGEMVKLLDSTDRRGDTWQPSWCAWQQNAVLVPTLVKALCIHNGTRAGGGAPDRQQRSFDSRLPVKVVEVLNCLLCLATQGVVERSDDVPARAMLLQQVRIMQAMQHVHLGA